MTPVVLVLTLLSRATRNRIDIGLAILLVVLFELQLALADIARANLARYPNVEVLTTTFEELLDGPGSYRTVVSATGATIENAAQY